MCTGAQAYAARKLLGWSADRLGAMCRIPGVTILQFEKNGAIPKPRRFLPEGRSDIDRPAVIRSTLEAAGIVFVDGEEPGVLLQGRDA